MPLQKEPPTTDSVSVFCVYAHEDRSMRDELYRHLLGLMRQRVITNWYDLETPDREVWKQEMKTWSNSADIILLLVSPDFINSEYCYSIEMSHALERHERGEARVIPIILRPVLWENTPLGKLQALPVDGKAITRWANQDEAFFNVVQGIRLIVLLLNQVVSKTKEQWILEGKKHYEEHQYDKALEAYKKAVELGADHELVREYLGRIQIELGLYDEALINYEDLLRRSPSASAYLFKGLVLQRVDKSVEALAAYQKAREYGYSG